MKKIIIIWILLLYFVPTHPLGCGVKEMEVQEEIYFENEDNKTILLINAATGSPVSATIFVNNSLSCCLDPVAGVFDVDPYSENKICFGEGIFDVNIQNPVIIVCSMNAPDTQIVVGFAHSILLTTTCFLLVDKNELPA